MCVMNVISVEFPVTRARRWGVGTRLFTSFYRCKRLVHDEFRGCDERQGQNSFQSHSMSLQTICCNDLTVPATRSDTDVLTKLALALVTVLK